MPKVSVIMATYNCERTISEAIDSILQQTLQDFELIICDDNSSDDTYNILQSYKNNALEKIILLRNECNMKLPYSLNRCLEQAKGEYIARMDGDDLSVPTRLKIQSDFLDNHPEYDLVGTDMTLFNDNGDFGTIQAPQNASPQTLLTGVPFCHATIMMRSRAFKILKGYTVKKRTERGQDIDLWFRFFEQGFQGYNLNKALYLVREDINAVKRRKLKYRFYESQTRYIGFKKLGFPIYQYGFVLLPIIKYFIPKTLKMKILGQK